MCVCEYIYAIDKSAQQWELFIVKEDFTVNSLHTTFVFQAVENKLDQLIRALNCGSFCMKRIKGKILFSYEKLPLLSIAPTYFQPLETQVSYEENFK